MCSCHPSGMLLLFLWPPGLLPFREELPKVMALAQLTAKVVPDWPSEPLSNWAYPFPKDSQGLRILILILCLSAWLLQPASRKGLLLEFSLYYFRSVFPFIIITL